MPGVMLLGSAGVHLRADPPFQPVNDMNFRCIPAAIDPARLRPSHPTPMRRPGLRDVNVVFPYQRLADLATGGVIGGVTEYQAQARIREGRTAAPGLADHLLLRR
jgi:hypothetical protein